MEGTTVNKQVTITVTNKTDSDIYLRYYRGQVYYTGTPQVVASIGKSADYIMSGDTYTHKLAVGDSKVYARTVLLHQYSYNISNVEQSYAMCDGVAVSYGNDLPSSISYYYTRDNLDQYSITTQYSNDILMPDIITAWDAGYKSLPQMTAPISICVDVKNAAYNHTQQTVIAVRTWTGKLIPAVCDVILDNALAVIILGTVLVVMVLRWLVPKLIELMRIDD